MTLTSVTLKLTKSQMGTLQSEWEAFPDSWKRGMAAVGLAVQPFICIGKMEVYFFTPAFSRELNKFLKQERFKA